MACPGPGHNPGETDTLDLVLDQGSQRVLSLSLLALGKKVLDMTSAQHPGWRMLFHLPSLAPALSLSCACVFGYEHGTLQSGAFPEKLYKALMSTQRSAGLPQGASSLPRGLDENKSCLAAVCLPAPKLAFT